MTVTHRKSGTAEHIAWKHMRGRCLNENNHKYPIYGARGISICAEWSSFEVFLANMGLKPTPRHTLDRINTNGNYEPSNCRWATPLEQVLNRRDSKRWIVDWRVFKSTQEAAAHFGVNPQTISNWCQGFIGWGGRRREPKNNCTSERIYPDD